MPNFDFTCQECGHVFEKVITIDGPDPVCIKCGKPDVKRHFPCPAVHFYYSPGHPRHMRGMLGTHVPPRQAKPQFRPDAPFLKKQKSKRKSKKNDT
jgi:putative FmdB family regulatory protein